MRVIPSALRPRFVLAFAAVASVTAIAVSLVSYILVGRARYGEAADNAMRQARLTLGLAADSLPAQATDEQVDAFASLVAARGGFDVVIFDDGRVVQTSADLGMRAVPDVVVETTEGGRMTHIRVRVDGDLYDLTSGRILPGGPAFYLFFPLEDVAVQLASLRNVLAAVSAVVVAASAALGAVVAGAFLRPIASAREAALKMSAGDLNVRLREEGRDEFSDLGRSFNEMARSLRESIRRLEDSQQSQRRFVADVSHELRTPLTALLTSAELLSVRAGDLDGQARQAAELVRTEVIRLKHLVEDLLEISRFDAGASQLATEPVQVRDFVEGIARTRGWAVVNDVPSSMRIVADPRRLDSILSNLIQNALTHGSPPVIVSAEAEPLQCKLSVTDHGQGVDPALVSMLFDRFFKGDPSRSRTEGTGLGLAIALENARLHGGNISVHSEPGRTVFTVVLPVTQETP